VIPTDPENPEIFFGIKLARLGIASGSIPKGRRDTFGIWSGFQRLAINSGGDCRVAIKRAENLQSWVAIGGVAIERARTRVIPLNSQDRRPRSQT
jgi:hypothetical protein